jgi:hypothetical protein
MSRARALLFVLLGALALTVVSSHRVRAAGDVNAAFKAFWDAPNPDAAEKTVRGIVDSGADFDTAWTRLKAGRTYAKEKTG